MCKITVHQGYEYRTYIKDLYDPSINGTKKEEEEYYLPQYKQAAKCIDEIAMRLDEYLEYEDTDSVGELDFSNASTLMGYPNNIVAFCSKRGQGKTSAMLAMLRALKEKDNEKKRESAEVFWNEVHKLNLANGSMEGKSPVLNKKYYVFATIDPTTMETHDSILDIILARIMAKAKAVHEQRQKEGQGNADRANFRDFIQNLDETVRRIHAIKGKNENDSFSELERVNETDDNRSPKYAFRKLVKVFLKYIGEYDMLVVPVDDSDMHTSRTYEIVEDLRKYCMIPRVLIVMALHLATLKNCIEQHFVESYKSLLMTGYDTDHLEKYTAREIAQRYIEKLLPDLHQIHLPYVSEKVEDGRKVLLSYLVKSEKDGKVIEENILKGDGTFFSGLARLIYDKTGVILLEPDGWLHEFMPKRMRELTYMLSFFSRMADIDDEDRTYQLTNLIIDRFYGVNPHDADPSIYYDQEKAEVLLKRRMLNLDQMEEYFFEHWCPNNLTKRLVKDMGQLRNAPIRSKNRRAVEILRSYTKEQDDKSYNQEKEKSWTESELDEISYADVLDELTNVRHTVRSPFKYVLIYAIEMYLTIYMNKIVCRSLYSKDSSILGELSIMTRRLMTRKNEFSVVKANGSLMKESGDSEIINNMKKLIRERKNGKGVALGVNETAKWLSKGIIRCESNTRTKYAFDLSLVFFNLMEHLIEKATEFVRKDNGELDYPSYFMVDRKGSELPNIIPAVTAIQYISNYDLQYSLRKDILERYTASSDSNLPGLLDLLYRCEEKDEGYSFCDVLEGSERIKGRHKNTSLDLYKRYKVADYWKYAFDLGEMNNIIRVLKCLVIAPDTPKKPKEVRSLEESMCDINESFSKLVKMAVAYQKAHYSFTNAEQSQSGDEPESAGA